ncbi:Rad61p SKDI_04G2460 [Saccharomyces kudriavzevii IFO 1802]|uniref:RAD61-like protein n=2 Tax=Saccharomyces kudriavzevii (strain ATCC MYA-4449 / AS 2.2408 / CBS 8840 / NBRC 1802 / NCYC 2889) TaxID=226230 RepID=J4TY89_SACK1|nr:uncharacterized protein SKDI_04G2460 [Saccharomyces kudriavzevii IFO 1802]EJT43065.1 RAD61-like protein [Saccharomyces kudriavzevii IFO 1802]CAI4057865.1 hypothetical protein SKDI_04G2460 [Saccharomyces kudriavzevii IFO 1802]
MRTYGRRGPVFRTSFRSNRGSLSSSNVEFSDDDVNSALPDMSSTMSSSVADDPFEGFLDKRGITEDVSPSPDGTNEDAILSVDPKGSTQNTEITRSDDTSIASIKKEKLSAFNFLDGSKISKTKRRRTYQRHDASTASSIEPNLQDEGNLMMQNESESIKQIYNDINEFILNLPRADDDVLNKMFENELNKDNVEEGENMLTSKDRKYGKSRTILISKNKENEMAEEEEDDQKANAVPTNNPYGDNSEKEGLTSTNHYNELKNMGDTIKYQDDIDFFLSNSKNSVNDSGSINDYFKKLLNLSLMIINDDGFFQYARRYFKKEIISLSFFRVELDFPELMLLQGYLLGKVSESQCDFPPSFESFSIELSRNEGSICRKNRRINKLSHLNFEDFLQETQFKTGLYYSLSLWEMYGKFSASMIKRISIIASNRDLFNQHVIKLIPLLEKMMSDSKFGLIFIKQPDIFDGVISNLNNQFKNMIDNDYFIRTLILLTNMEGHNHKLWESMDMIFQDSMNTILKGIHPLIDAKVDNVLLHLGLCLNLCGGKNCDLEVDDELWHNMRATFLKMIRDDSEVENRLMQGLFYLNFAFVVNQRKEGDYLDSWELNTLTVALEAFESETSQFNEGISSKIEIALHYLRSIHEKKKSTI